MACCVFSDFMEMSTNNRLEGGKTNFYQYNMSKAELYIFEINLNRS